MAAILVIDDDEMFSMMITDLAKRLGHRVTSSSTLKTGLEVLGQQEVDVVLLDVRLPDGNGLAHIPEIQASPSRPEVIIVTGFREPAGAELALKSGAWDYLEKASGIKELTLPIVRALQYRRAREGASARRPFNRTGILGNTHVLQTCLDAAARAASIDSSVLIVGETGTGKELFARAIHENSDRCGADFVPVDCAALPASLMESVLFGHEKGAFTGADRAREGLIQQAHEGTLFLDEVGELPLQMQKTFLRVLQERRFRPIGSSREVESRFRLVAATNRDLEKMVEHGRFRHDLLFRLQGAVLQLPPLRERKEDIAELTMVHLARICKQYQMSLKGFSTDFLEVLLAHDWPGNVRELFHTIELAFAEARDEHTLFSKHLPIDLRIKARGGETDKGRIPKTSPRTLPSRKTFPTLQEARSEAIAAVEEQYITSLLDHCEGAIPNACAMSGLSRSQLYRLMQKYGLTRPGKEDPGKQALTPS